MGIYIKARFAYDPDAQAFFTASGLTGSTNLTAINNLVVALKGFGIWTKMKAIYPMIGGTAALHKWNLKDPRDLDAAFRLVFNGGWTHSSTGAQGNGVNGYANTYFNGQTQYSVATSAHLSLYSRLNQLQTDIDFGAYDSVNVTALIIHRPGYSGNTLLAVNDAAYLQGADTNSLGFYIGNRNGTSKKCFKNNTTLSSDISTATGRVNQNLFLSTLNNNGIPDSGLLSNKEWAFASIGDGLTDTEAANFYTAVQAYQTTLGRSIGTQTVSDPDAQAFVTAANIEDQVQAQAVNQLTIDMKAANIWNKMKAIYPFVGGTASSHKWNLKDPLDTNAAFRLTFNGGWTHSSTGAKPNGTNGYADTFFNVSTGYSVSTSAHISFYSRTNNIENSIQIGTFNITTNTALQIQIRNGAAVPYNTRSIINNLTWHETTDSNSLGFYVANRSGTTVNNFKNNTNLGTGTNTATTRPNSKLFIGAQSLDNGMNLPSAKECAFSTIGDGLTDTEAANFYTAVQNFNTALNRQVV